MFRSFLMYIEHFITDEIFFIVVAFALFLILRVRVRKKAASLLREISVAAFTLYIIWLFAATVLPDYDISRRFGLRFSGFASDWETFRRTINLIPLRQFYYVYNAAFNHGYGFFYYFTNIFGNIAVFMPVGFTLPILWGFGTAKTILTGFAASCAIEILQLPQVRISDVDDILLNTGGTALGVLVFTLCCGFFPGIRSIIHKR